ncbi:MAG: hypothetical protein ACREN6_09035 [Gemmatimonadaceae bacterium]
MRKAMTIAATGLAILGGAAIAAASPAYAGPGPMLTSTLVAPQGPCLATISTPIVAGTANQEITVSLSEELQDSLTVDVAPESNLKVSGVTRDPGSKLVKMQVDATNGAPGTWALTLSGKNASCKGQVKVSGHARV